MKSNIQQVMKDHEPVGLERFFDRFGLNDRYLVLPMISAPLTGLVFVLFGVLTEPRSIPTLNWAFVEVLLFVVMVAFVTGILSILTGLPGWLAGWAVARKLGLGTRTARIAASGCAAFSGVALMIVAMKFRYGLSAMDMRGMFAISLVAVPVSMAVGLWLFAEKKNEVKVGQE